MATIGVYGIRHIATDRWYVGRSRDVAERMRRHFEDSRRRDERSLIHRAIDKYGKDAFDWCILEECATEEQTKAQEVHWINTLRARTHGFNLTDGGDGRTGYVMPDETRNKLRSANLGTKHSAERRQINSDAQRKRFEDPAVRAKATAQLSAHRSAHGGANKGRRFGDEWRENLSRAHRGKRHSEETRRRMSAARMGHPVSDETRKRISEAKRGKPRRRLSDSTQYLLDIASRVTCGDITLEQLEEITERLNG